jgi:type IV secretory pathway VirB2 component (pilin)
MTPSPDNPIAAALAWLQGTFLGSLATATAVIAVAAVGYLMLIGRIDVRRAIQVVFGCFLLFGASSIAQGIVNGMNGSAAPSVPVSAEPALVVMPAPQVTYPPKPAQPFDPYAGAAVPTQQ